MSETVVFVDDSKLTLQIIRDLFSNETFKLLTVASAEEALDIIRAEEVALVVTDNIMPGISGIEFLSSLSLISPDTVKILMSAYADLSSALAAINQSEVFRFVLKPWENEDLLVAVRDGLHRSRLIQSMRKEDDDVLRSLAQTIELKDSSTKGHCDRVAIYSLAIASALALPKEIQRQIKYGSWLHDCGKIGISEAILNGLNSLNDEELEIMKNHSLWGADVAAKANLSEIAKNVIRYHHERFDGKGYPSGLAHTDIPLEARIVAVADVYDALTSERSYRKSYSKDEALSIVASMSGIALDNEIVNLFFEIINNGKVADVSDMLLSGVAETSAAIVGT